MDSAKNTSARGNKHLVAELGEKRYDQLMQLLHNGVFIADGSEALIADGNTKLAKECHDFAYEAFGGEALVIASAEQDNKKTDQQG